MVRNKIQFNFRPCLKYLVLLALVGYMISMSKIFSPLSISWLHDFTLTAPLEMMLHIPVNKLQDNQLIFANFICTYGGSRTYLLTNLNGEKPL